MTKSVSVRVSVRGVRCRALLATALVASAFLMAAGPASADTPFGGNPNGAITPELTCEKSASYILAGWHAPTCLWFWSHIGVGSDIVPLPVTGGSATITSVTLPAMPNPGTMQVVILTSALSATREPGKPEFVCCQVKTLGPTFTVPANAVTTVPQSLTVSATEEANLSIPGDTSFGDIAAISVLTPGASLPLRYTGKTSLNSSDGGDNASAYMPAPTATSGEFNVMDDPSGFEMMAQFALGATPAPAPAPPPAPTPGPAAKGGVKLGGKTFTPGADGKTLGLGKATNPPTASTTQTLTLPTGAGRALSARASAAGKSKKPVVLGKGKTTVPSGKSAPIKLTLNSKARAKLAHGHSLKATLTIVATNPQGESQTVTKAVTVKPAKRPKRN